MTQRNIIMYIVVSKQTKYHTKTTYKIQTFYMQTIPKETSFTNFNALFLFFDTFCCFMFSCHILTQASTTIMQPIGNVGQHTELHTFQGISDIRQIYVLNEFLKMPVVFDSFETKGFIWAWSVSQIKKSLLNIHNCSSKISI